MAVHDGAGHLTRAVDSVLSQSLSNIEFIAVDCDSHDRTPAMLESSRDRDIRVEVITRASDDLLAGFAAGLAAARGDYVAFMRQDDWLAPDYLRVLIERADEDDLELVFGTRSADTWDRKGDTCDSRCLSWGDETWTTPEEIRGRVGVLYERGLFDGAAGALVARPLAQTSHGASTTVVQGFAYIMACIAHVSRMGVVESPCYHAVSYKTAASRAFDPRLAERCADEHAQIMGLVTAWGLQLNPDVMGPIHRRHVRRLIECIDNASVGTSSSATSNERVEQVQSMIDADDARESLRAVEPDSHEFGIMYRPMAKGNAQGCCFGARLREFARISHLPLV
ncbi:glycosyltransferase [Collinsella tanakaei]|nr:glycosyltransferase [Collinsella tanakaei]